MNDQHGSNWHAILPWVLLGQRTAYQPELGASPMELVYGQPVKIPGDLAGGDLHPQSDLPTLLETVRRKTARPPVPTAHHATPTIHIPKDMATATHVLVRCAKTTPLGPNYKGPYRILERPGDSTLKIRVGTYANGQPRHELVHWQNCKIPNFEDEPITVDRPALGRKPKESPPVNASSSP